MTSSNNDKPISHLISTRFINVFSLIKNFDFITLYNLYIMYIFGKPMSFFCKYDYYFIFWKFPKNLALTINYSSKLSIRDISLLFLLLVLDRARRQASSHQAFRICISRPVSLLRKAEPLVACLPVTNWVSCLSGRGVQWCSLTG